TLGFECEPAEPLLPFEPFEPFDPVLASGPFELELLPHATIVAPTANPTITVALNKLEIRIGPPGADTTTTPFRRATVTTWPSARSPRSGTRCCARSRARSAAKSWLHR